MPRSIWNGTITFGLLNVPVKVFSATEDRTIHFHQVHAADGSRIEHRRICPKDGKEVGYDHIVRGYEVAKGGWVELTDDEVAAAAGSRGKLVDIDHFVPAEDIDPVFYERTYHLGAGRGRLPRGGARRHRAQGGRREHPAAGGAGRRAGPARSGRGL